MGYDIADYKDIDPMYGTLGDVDHMIKEIKSRGMKLMMDLVVNHTSDQVRDSNCFLAATSSLSSLI
jgi:glycosidase